MQRKERARIKRVLRNLNTMLKTILTSNDFMKKATGLEMEQFQVLCFQIKEVKEEKKEEQDRQRSFGGGRKPKLSYEEQVLLVLFWYKLYLPLWLLGLISSIHPSNVSKLIKKYRELIWEGADPELDERLANLDSECELNIDATEQEIKRPKRKKKCYYSGKKKFHTIGTQIATEAERNLVVHVSNSYPGAVHDYKIFKRSKIANKIPEGVKINLDSGYQGINDDYPELKATIPHKKKRGKKKLSAKEKKHNRALSSRRIKVEHANCRIKKYEVINGVYRMNPEYYNQDFRNVVSLVNFRILHPKKAA